jgi:hypothetical protein
MLAIERIQELLHDPTTSDWLRHALRWALNRDPVDAAGDADILNTILQIRAGESFQIASTEDAETQ